MARPITLSNGELHIGINKFGMVHDFYYPYVGHENHALGADTRHKVGVWVDGAMYWLDSGEWQFTFRYAHRALIGHTRAKHTGIGVILEFDDVVDWEQNAFLRNIHVVNAREDEREIKLYLRQAFAIGDTRSNTDTAQYLPDTPGILHYRGRRAFIASGRLAADNTPFDQFTVGLFGIEGYEGSWRDAEDGELSGGVVEHGRVDSVLGFTLRIAGHSSARVHYWIAAGRTLDEVEAIDANIRETGVTHRLLHASQKWHEWLEPTDKVLERVPQKYRQSFLHSLLIIKSQIDKHGAVIASTDTALLHHARDAYAYCWPRDGALVLWPLIRLGYTKEPHNFFQFCKRVLHPGGYLMHKYRADGALGPSWHPYVHKGGVHAPPIQTDETALALFVFCQYAESGDPTRLREEFYDDLVRPMARFLASYIDSSTGLPKPSYDLWEERFGVHTFTAAATYGALTAAADLAEAYHEDDDAVQWRSAASEMRVKFRNLAYNTERHALYRTITPDKTDNTLDVSSFFGAFIFGLYAPGSDELLSTYTTLRDECMQPDSPGIPRYEGDTYQRPKGAKSPNSWIITSLWMAQYAIERGEEDVTYRTLDWVLGHTSETDTLAEQVSAATNQEISVEPLTWSHAEYISTLLDVIAEDKL